MADDVALPIGPPADQVAAFAAKGIELGFDWRDVWQEEHSRAFTVAKAMSRDLVEDIRAEVRRAIDEGTTLDQFVKELKPRLVSRGWWGRDRMVDPLTGEDKVVQLGSPARLRTIYQTNMRTSQMAGKWARIERTKRAFPLLRYVTAGDARVRDEHDAWQGIILPVDHPWWDTHYPPNAFNCRCDIQPVNQRMADRRGWKVNDEADIPRGEIREYVNRRTGEVTRLERGIDPGFAYNVGRATLDGLTPPPRTGPPPEDGIWSELNATLDADYEALSGFFEPFGLRARAAARAGTVFVDVAGWPLPISTGLFQGSDGEDVRLTREQLDWLPGAARTIIEPDRIGWLWIGARDGRAMLVRRYQGPLGSVDFGRGFWRWMGPRAGAFARGRLIWTREDGVLNARRYVRDSTGRFARTGSGGTDGFVGAIERGEGAPHRHDLAPIGGGAAGKLNQLGLSATNNRGDPKMVSLDRSNTRHILKRHGADSRGQIAIQAADLANMPMLLESGTLTKPSKSRSRNGAPLVQVSGSVGKRRYSAVFEVRKHTIVPKSLFRKR
ncbi:phage minor head protein [Citromicrobium bathyomarinum]|uniref:phage minor head protein n=1 Tax=Citromicrobium bathyomarinum TaxID=72174 RepID=UPI00315B2DF6